MATTQAGDILAVVAATIVATPLPENADGRPLQFVENDYLAAEGMTAERSFDILLREMGIDSTTSHVDNTDQTQRRMNFDVNLFYVASGMNMRALSATVAADCASVMDRVPREIHQQVGGAHCEVSDSGAVFQPVNGSASENNWMLTIPFESAWLEAVED